MTSSIKFSEQVVEDKLTERGEVSRGRFVVSVIPISVSGQQVCYSPRSECRTVQAEAPANP